MDRPTGTDNKVERAEEPEPPGKPSAPPPDKPGTAGRPSRLESLARAREPVEQWNGTQKAEVEGNGTASAEERGPKAEGKGQNAAKPISDESSPGSTATATGERGEEADNDGPSPAGSRYRPPADNPGSPSQPSRLESLARAREAVEQQNGTQEAKDKDSGAGASDERLSEQTDGSEEPAPASEGKKQPSTARAEISGSPSGESRLESLARAREAAQQETGVHKNEVETPAEDSDIAAYSQATDTPDDFDRRISGDGLADDDGRMAESDEVALERGISDRLKQIAAKFELGDRPKELAGTVDRPDFQDPMGDPFLTPDRYGTPLDRPDGTRTPLFKGEPTREQTQQGTLGDCGVIATLGAVAGHSPEVIRDCVREIDDGNYEVRLHEAKYSPSKQCYVPTGRPIILTVTPELPIEEKKPDIPSFARTTSAGVAWAPVLEKAIAGADQTWSARQRARATELWNVQGHAGDAPKGYVRLNQGTNPGQRAELLTQLTGRPAKTVRFPDGYDNKGRSADRRLQDEIAGQLAQNKPVLVGTRELLKNESTLPAKLVENHAYEVTKIDDQGRLHLRNPWNERHPEPMTLRDFKASMRPRYTTLE